MSFILHRDSNRPLLHFGNYILDETHVFQMKGLLLSLMEDDYFSKKFPNIQEFPNIKSEINKFAKFYTAENYKPFQVVYDEQTKTEAFHPGYYLSNEQDKKNWEDARSDLQLAGMTAFAKIQAQNRKVVLSADQEVALDNIRLITEIARESRIDPYFDAVLRLLAEKKAWVNVLTDIGEFERDKKKYRDQHAVKVEPEVEAEEELVERASGIREASRAWENKVRVEESKVAAETSQAGQPLRFGEGSRNKQTPDMVSSESLMSAIEDLAKKKHVMDDLYTQSPRSLDREKKDKATQAYKESLAVFLDKIGDFSPEERNILLKSMQRRFGFAPELPQKPSHQP